MTTKKKVQAFVNEFVELCKKHNMILIGRYSDESVVPVDLITLERMDGHFGEFDTVQEFVYNYYSELTDDKTVDFCVKVIEENN